MKKIVEIQTTYPDMSTALKASQHLVSLALAACSNIVAAQSIYQWDGKLQQDSESLLILKTTLEKIDATLDAIKKNHPYELPSIVYFEVNTTDEYGGWVQDACK
ncbi:MAG: divalent-cation tolerance protein CutA [Saprospiraceae bacterium]